MYIETPLTTSASLTQAIEGVLDPYSFLYALFVFVLIPVVLFVANQACAAVIGHYALHICMRKAREEKAALEAANRDLQDQNCRLMTVNALLVTDVARLTRANKRLLKRALTAELTLAGPQPGSPSATGRNAGPAAG